MLFVGSDGAYVMSRQKFQRKMRQEPAPPASLPRYVGIDVAAYPYTSQNLHPVCIFCWTLLCGSELRRKVFRQCCYAPRISSHLRCLNRLSSKYLQLKHARVDDHTKRPLFDRLSHGKTRSSHAPFFISVLRRLDCQVCTPQHTPSSLTGW